jgi:hypothetical protein
MDNKDRFLLESLYESIYLKEENEAPEEADYDEATHSGVSYDPSVHGDLPRGNESDEEEHNSDLSEDVPDGGVKIDKNTPLSYFKDGEIKNVIVEIHPNEIVKLYFDGEKFTHAVALDTRRGGDGVKNDTKVTISGLNSAFNRLKTDKSPFYNNISTVISWASADRENFGGEDDHIDAAYEDRYSHYESVKIPHGIQPISEAKKKVNPWAIEKSIENKTGKKFGKKHKEEIIKGIKKSAKKSGKKITSEPVKSKKKVTENFHDVYNAVASTGLQLAPESSLKYAMETLLAAYAPLAATGAVIGVKNLVGKLKNYFATNKSANNIPIGDNLKKEVDILKSNPKNHISFDKIAHEIAATIKKSSSEEVQKKLKANEDPQVLKAREELAKLRNPQK